MRFALAGALALAVAQGVGRFAYTALLPATQRGLGFDDAVGGALASANLLGYLAGAWAGRSLATSPRRGNAVRAALAIVVLSTALLTVTGSWWGWALLRLAAGFAGGVVFVLVSVAALEPRRGEVARPGLLYAGVGFGIALTGTTAALLPVSAWQEAWLSLAGIGAVLSIPAWSAVADAPATHVRASSGAFPPASATEARQSAPGDPAAVRRPPPFSLARLCFAYFLEAVGYIVSGTFTVLAIRRTPGLEHLAAWAWTLAGLAAIPSALLWSALGRRLGLRGALVAAHLTQAAGMALPLVSPSAAAALLGAMFFGGTFIGIATLTMSAAAVIAPERFGRTVGTLTVVYGIGQMVGPALAGAISNRVGSTGPAVMGAAVAVALGGLLLARRGAARRPAPLNRAKPLGK
jgi:MFS family permease